MEIIIIAAVSQNGIIGNRGVIPWNTPQELEHFKSTTVGYPVLMGRKTFQSLDKPLTDRINMVLSMSDKSSSDIHDTFFFQTINCAIDFCKKNNFTKLFIIGGAEIYRQTLEIATELILSKMPFICDGDTTFPAFDEKHWELSNTIDKTDFVIEVYTRV